MMGSVRFELTVSCRLDSEVPQARILTNLDYDPVGRLQTSAGLKLSLRRIRLRSRLGEPQSTRQVEAPARSSPVHSASCGFRPSTDGLVNICPGSSRGSMPELDVRRAVKDRYSKIATTAGGSDCGGAGCCGGAGLVSLGVSVPPEAVSAGAGCGSPLSLVRPLEGEVVLDLGSGGGIDVFRASALVGPRGRALGVDSTPEMVWLARETKARYGDRYANAEFRLGEIEHLPIGSKSVDYVISNCVLNLVPDKPAAFREAFRVLRDGGTFAVADVTLQNEIPEAARMDMDSWSACIAGALVDAEYEAELRRAGFEDVAMEHLSDSNLGAYPFKYHSSHIKARKPSVRARARRPSSRSRRESLGPSRPAPP